MTIKEQGGQLSPNCREAVKGILDSVQAGLVIDVEVVESEAPSITDPKELLLDATIAAAKLAGMRMMYERIMEAMGLTIPDQSGTMW